MPTYFITFTTYGTRLHGDERGSVDRHTSGTAAPMLEPHAGREHVARASMSGQPVTLGVTEREVVEDAIHHVCQRRGWKLHALNVRSNHVHAVLSAEQRPEDVMIALKAWGTRFLADRSFRERRARIWAVHGSTRWIKTEASFDLAVNYVLFEQ